MRNESMAMRRIIRANRLLIEQGHKGDTIGALNEMDELHAAISTVMADSKKVAAF